MASKSVNKTPNPRFSGSKGWFILAIIFALIGAGSGFFVLTKSLETTTYYVLNTDVPARSQITPGMLDPVSASKGSEPRNALTLDDVQYNNIYAKVGLNAGDTLAMSNAGDLAPLLTNVPDNFVAVSFSVDANNAVGGKLIPGDYIDLYSTKDSTNSEAKESKAVLRHILVKDVTESATDYQESEDATDDTSAQDQLRSGIPSLYTVAVSPKDASTIATVRGDDLFIALSSNQSNADYKAEDTYTSSNEAYDQNKNAPDAGEGTSNNPEDESATVDENADNADATQDNKDATPADDAKK